IRPQVLPDREVGRRSDLKKSESDRRFCQIERSEGVPISRKANPTAGSARSRGRKAFRSQEKRIRPQVLPDREVGRRSDLKKSESDRRFCQIVRSEGVPISRKANPTAGSARS